MQLHGCADSYRSIATSALCVWTNILPLHISNRVYRIS